MLDCIVKIAQLYKSNKNRLPLRSFKIFFFMSIRIRHLLKLLFGAGTITILLNLKNTK